MIQNPFTTAEFTHLDPLLGTSHTSDAVSVSLLDKKMLVSRTNNVICPSPLPPLLSASQHGRVIDLFERELEDEMVELLYKIDPALKLLPNLWTGELAESPPEISKEEYEEMEWELRVLEE